MDIALQHLDEIPDYYTRLKKMEASAKKEHRRSFKDIKEYFDDVDSSTYPKNSVHLELDRRYCPKCKKMFNENKFTLQPVTDEYCMQLQLNYFCSGKTQPVTEQDYLQL
jgi:hypothetical protein